MSAPLSQIEVLRARYITYMYDADVAATDAERHRLQAIAYLALVFAVTAYLDTAGATVAGAREVLQIRRPARPQGMDS